MSTVSQAIDQLRSNGASIKLDHGHIRVVWRCPTEALSKVQDALAVLRANKAQAIATLIRHPSASSGFEKARPDTPAIHVEWPVESHEYEKRFGHSHAKLFPFLGRTVRTRLGRGTLIQVFWNRATVALDSNPTKCVVFPPNQIVPIIEL